MNSLKMGYEKNTSITMQWVAITPQNCTLYYSKRALPGVKAGNNLLPLYCKRRQCIPQILTLYMTL